MAEEHSAAIPLPAGGAVDVNALHDALKAGQSGEKALEAAVIVETIALSPDEARARAIQSAQDNPSLSRVGKDRLLKIAAAEMVSFAKGDEGQTIAVADATAPQLVEAITLNRAHLSGVNALPEPAEAPGGAAGDAE